MRLHRLAPVVIMLPLGAPAMAASASDDLYHKVESAHHYVAPQMVPKNILPAPPRPGSAAQQDDTQTYLNTRKLEGTDRWALATSDARLSSSHILKSFSCSTGIVLTSSNAPALAALIRKVTATGVESLRSEKRFWHRHRPFEVLKGSICTNDERKRLTTDPSYPSGHTTLGWSTALILSQVFPDRAQAILQRGRTFGESRIVCGAHWKSDVIGGFLFGSVVATTVQQSREFQQDLLKASEEVAKLRSNPSTEKPNPKECRLEDEAARNSALFQQ